MTPQKCFSTCLIVLFLTLGCGPKTMSYKGTKLGTVDFECRNVRCVNCAALGVPREGFCKAVEDTLRLWEGELGFEAAVKAADAWVAWQPVGWWDEATPQATTCRRALAPLGGICSPAESPECVDKPKGCEGLQLDWRLVLVTLRDPINWGTVIHELGHIMLQRARWTEWCDVGPDGHLTNCDQHRWLCERRLLPPGDPSCNGAPGEFTDYP